MSWKLMLYVLLILGFFLVSPAYADSSSNNSCQANSGITDYSNLGAAVLAVSSAVLLYLFQSRSDLLKDLGGFEKEIYQFRTDSKNKLVDEKGNIDSSVHSEIVDNYRIILSKLDDLHKRDSRLIMLIGISVSILLGSAIVSISFILENSLGVNDNTKGCLPMYSAIFVITLLVVLHIGLLVSEIREEKR